MISWILITVFVIALIVIVKFKEIRHKFGFLFIVFILLFLAITIWQVYKNNNLSFDTFDDLISASRIYVSWLGQVFTNVKGVTGYVVNQQWGLSNSTLGNFTG
jgi:Na+/phosphate symporter